MEDHNKVWRYMSLSRFIWLIQHEALWLSRVDLLEDPWECAITGEEITYLAQRAPITPISRDGGETVSARMKRLTEMWRTTTFINCWCAREEESHALWRVFCGHEGVAIRTNWRKLVQLAENMRVVEVDYTGYGRVRTPQLEKVSMRKRRMYDYEHEVRIIAQEDTQNPKFVKEEFGFRLGFNPPDFIDQIIVHPEADNAFFEVVAGIVDTYVPELNDRLAWSVMSEVPPIIQV